MSNKTKKRKIRLALNALESLSAAKTRTEKLDSIEKSGVKISRKSDAKKVDKKFEQVTMDKMVIVQKEINRQKEQNKRRNLRNKRSGK